MEFAVSVRRNYANPHVSEDVGRVAISRGPFVYCLEGVDNGTDLNCLELPEQAPLHYTFEKDLLQGVGTITAEGKRVQSSDEESLYRNQKPEETAASLRWIPYYAWANRGENDMMVWIREK